MTTISGPSLWLLAGAALLTGPACQPGLDAEPFYAAEEPRRPPTPAHSSALCGGFSGADTVAAQSLAWSFRLCSFDSDSLRVEFRFSNLRSRLFAFSYKVWFDDPVTCSTHRQPHHQSKARRLLSHQTDAWPYEATTVHLTEYKGRLWLCVAEAEFASQRSTERPDLVEARP